MLFILKYENIYDTMKSQKCHLSENIKKNDRKAVANVYTTYTLFFGIGRIENAVKKIRRTYKVGRINRKRIGYIE